MKLGFIGLGKMGLNMTKRLVKNHKIVAYDVNRKVYSKLDKKIERAKSLQELTSKLVGKKVIWMMVPAGRIVDATIKKLMKHLTKGDILIDGGNSNYKDSQKIEEELKKKGIIFLDVGTSGGIWGIKEGYALMVGGDKKAYNYILPVLKTLSVKDGYEYMGKSGAGHFVKMVHNGIEYGLMQAYAEGFEILKTKKDLNLNLHKISKLWNINSVVRSWLLKLIEKAFKKDQSLKNIKAYVEDSGEGRWTIKEAIDLDVSVPVITSALYERFTSRNKNSFQDKLLAKLRDEFGGHGVKKG